MMFKMLGAAVVAVALSFAGSAGAAVLIWSGVVVENNRGGNLFYPQVAGLYTFVSDAPITEFYHFGANPELKYTGFSDGTVEWGHNWARTTWASTGKPEPILTLTSTGFTLYIDPPQDRVLRTELDPCLEWYGCGYTEYWKYRTEFYMLLRFAPGNEGKALALYFEPGPPPSAIPEPATWAMMIIGFGGVGTMVRIARRRNGLSIA